MNCYDTSHSTTQAVAAVAICHHCGAALCVDHVHECAQEIIHHNMVGSASISEPAGRSLCCSTCQVAGTGPSHRRD